MREGDISPIDFTGLSRIKPVNSFSVKKSNARSMPATGRMHLCPGGFGKREAGAPEHGDEVIGPSRNCHTPRCKRAVAPTMLFQDL